MLSQPLVIGFAEVDTQASHPLRVRGATVFFEGRGVQYAMYLVLLRGLAGEDAFGNLFSG
jgi:hypothetical protein